MLPDIKTRRKLWGINKRSYDNRQLHQILDIKNHDGCTTNNCVEIVRRLNDYWEESRYLVIEASTIFMCMKGMSEGEFDHADNEVLRLYSENIDKPLLISSMSNMMRVIKSLAQQRKLVWNVKKVIKKNRINQDWEDLLTEFIVDLEKRMKYVSEIVIPANVENTPMGAYMDYLSRMGIDILEDIRLYIDNNGNVFDDDDESVMIYKDHVLRILCELDREMAEALVEKARKGMESRRIRIESAKKESEAEKIAKTSAGLEECKAMVLSLCSSAGPVFRKHRTRSLYYRSKHYSDVWVVSAASVFPRRTGYLKRSGGRFCVSNVENATIFNTQEEADSAARSFRECGPARVAEIANVELYSFGIG